MYGRSLTRLLAISFLILLPGFVRGQSDRTDPAAQLASDLARTLPHPVQPPDRDPTASLRRRLPITPGTFGFPQPVSYTHLTLPTILRV